MIGNKRVIGVCLTKMHWSGHSAFMDALVRYARQEDAKLMLFNSFSDYQKNDNNSLSSQKVLEIINYDVVDALIIQAPSFNNKNVVAALAEKARKSNVPVVLVNDQHEGCFSVWSEFVEPFVEMMTHVIKVHNRRDTFFMAGMQSGDLFSNERLDCYKRVLKECGLPFDETKVGYGEFWSEPAKRIVQQLHDEKRIPQAIFCANDYMAVATCEKLGQLGYRVPEDVIVTGFDGTDAARYALPQVTTCVDDLDGLAKMSLRAALDGIAGALCRHDSNVHKVHYTESCGCKKLSQEEFRKTAAMLNNTVDTVQMHEDYMYSWMDRMFNIEDMSGLYAALAGSILEDSYVCLNSDIIGAVMDGKPRENRTFTQQMLVLSSRYTAEDKGLDGYLSLKKMVPGLEKWAEDDTVFVINAIYAGSIVCGYYAYRTNNFQQNAHKIKRIVNTINLAFNVAMNYFLQMRLRYSVDNAALVNSVTQLPNLKGAIRWLQEFATPKNREKALTVSVYGMPKYTYIQENFGIRNLDEAIAFVAEALKLANTDNCFIGHIAADEFVVINYYDSADQIGPTINRATTVFFNAMEDYNKNSGKEYFVEMNCGCTTIEKGWQPNLESYIKFAKSEMYMNRLKSGMANAIKEEASPSEYYKAFDLLLQKNLFTYHYQPIVNAKNGEIFGYEALMRTDKSIGMNPLDVLKTAKEYNRLYEVEKATMFNIMGQYADEAEKFCGRKVFINTIPGYFLNDTDMKKLTNIYGSYMDQFFFELTEQNTVSDDELNAIRSFLGNDENARIAIDDYGTGHSNMANLLRYSPRIIKIDRFLIDNIYRNKNKQLFVRSTVEFAKLNNILVLAEGVETSNELHTVIDLGVDLVQGYYLGRPVPNPVPRIQEDIVQEIINANPIYSKNWS